MTLPPPCIDNPPEPSHSLGLLPRRNKAQTAAQDSSKGGARGYLGPPRVQHPERGRGIPVPCPRWRGRLGEHHPHANPDASPLTQQHLHTSEMPVEEKAGVDNDAGLGMERGIGPLPLHSSAHPFANPTMSTFIYICVYVYIHVYIHI